MCRATASLFPPPRHCNGPTSLRPAAAAAGQPGHPTITVGQLRSEAAIVPRDCRAHSFPASNVRSWVVPAPAAGLWQQDWRGWRPSCFPPDGRPISDQSVQRRRGAAECFDLLNSTILSLPIVSIILNGTRHGQWNLV